MNAKTPNPVDRHVGSRVRMQRTLMGMSQSALGDALNVTFQQVQKYEKGTNRIGAGRLQQIAHVLNVPVEFFFEGMPRADEVAGPEHEVSQLATRFLSLPVGLRVMRAFMRIENRSVQSSLADLVETLAAAEENQRPAQDDEASPARPQEAAGRGK